VRRPTDRAWHVSALGGLCLTRMLDLAADVSLTCHNYFRFVRDGAFLRDLGAPFIAVDHGTLEEWGIRTCSPSYESAFHPSRCTSCRRAAAIGRSAAGP